MPVSEITTQGVQHSPFRIPSRHSLLSNIEKIEGCRDEIPPSILRELSHHMDQKDWRRNFSMKRWKADEQSLYIREGLPAAFEGRVLPSEDLKTFRATRFSYDKDRQIVVIELPDLRNIKESLPAIVVFKSPGLRSITVREGWITSHWKIWIPKKPLKPYRRNQRNKYAIWRTWQIPTETSQSEQLSGLAGTKRHWLASPDADSTTKRTLSHVWKEHQDSEDADVEETNILQPRRRVARAELETFENNAINAACKVPRQGNVNSSFPDDASTSRGQCSQMKVENAEASQHTIDLTHIDYSKVQVLFVDNDGLQRGAVSFDQCNSGEALFDEACVAQVADKTTRTLEVQVGGVPPVRVRRDNQLQHEQLVVRPLDELLRTAKVKGFIRIKVGKYM